MPDLKELQESQDSFMPLLACKRHTTLAKKPLIFIPLFLFLPVFFLSPSISELTPNSYSGRQYYHEYTHFLLDFFIVLILKTTKMTRLWGSHLQKSHSNGSNKGHGQFQQKSCTLDVQNLKNGLNFVFIIGHQRKSPFCTFSCINPGLADPGTCYEKNFLSPFS